MASRMSMVLAGGVALGAYQGGALAAMRHHLDRLDWLVGVSIGAVNAAIIAGNAPGDGVEALDAFWKKAASPAPPGFGVWREGLSWTSAAQSRSLGASGIFRPRSPVEVLRGGTGALYDLSPLARELTRIVDFDRLNAGDTRVTIMATDIRSGTPVVFDTEAGDRIEPVHVLASCGFIPEFMPVEVDGRLLGDGALAANAPVELALGGQTGNDDHTCFVLDLFARKGEPPSTILNAAERRLDLLLGNPNHRAVESLRREDRLRRLLARAADQVSASGNPDLKPVSDEARRGRTTVYYLCHGTEPRGAGPDKQFDFSKASLSERWRAGDADMRQALDLLEGTDAEHGDPGFSVHYVGSGTA